MSEVENVANNFIVMRWVILHVLIWFVILADSVDSIDFPVGSFHECRFQSNPLHIRMHMPVAGNQNYNCHQRCLEHENHNSGMEHSAKLKEHPWIDRNPSCVAVQAGNVHCSAAATFDCFDFALERFVEILAHSLDMRQSQKEYCRSPTICHFRLNNKQIMKINW